MRVVLFRFLFRIGVSIVFFFSGLGFYVGLGFGFRGKIVIGIRV